MEIFLVLVLVVALIGTIGLGPILNKYRGVFGVPKAYIVTTCLCVAAAGIESDSIMITVLCIIGGIILSFGVSILLTKKVNPIMWLAMIIVAFGWCLRFILHFIGIAMPVIAANAEADLKQQQAADAARQQHNNETDRIQSEAFRRFGTRGQVNSDNTRWRADSDSDWQNVTW